MAEDKRSPRQARPGYRDWRQGLIAIAVVVVLGALFLGAPDYGPYIAVAAAVAFLVWRFATARRDR